MLRRGFISLLILLTGIVGLAYADETIARDLYEGYCENGEPVVIRWDSALDQYFRPGCAGTTLILLQKELGSDAPPVQPRTYPDAPGDWSAWASVWINGKVIANPYQDVVPYVTASSGRTLIPIRMVTEALGGSAAWNESTQTVTIRLNDKYMEMTIGKSNAMANGQPVTLDQPPLLWLNRTMVPLRVLAEAFGAQVNWTQDVRRVDITLPGVDCTPGYCLEWLE